MKTACLLRRVGLALGGALFCQLAQAQRVPIAPLAPARVAVVVPKPEGVGQRVSRTGSASVRIVCRPSGAGSPPVLVLLDSRILVGWVVLSQINPREIAVVYVYKDAGELPGWPAFTSVSGLIDLKLKREIRVPSLTPKRLKHRLHLTGTVQLEQYGQLLPSALLRTAKADVGAVTVRVVAPGTTRIVLPVAAVPVGAALGSGSGQPVRQ